MPVAGAVQRFIVDHLLKGKQKTIGPDESLIASGTMDSLSWLQLVSFIEKQFGIRVTDDELVPETFETVNAICAFVERKRAGSSL